MNRLFTAFIFCLSCMFLFSCDKDDDDSKQVMVILKDQISYWESVKSGIDKACSELDVTCDVRWTSSDGDSESQIAAITEYKSHISKYSGMVIAPSNKDVCDFLGETLDGDSKPLIILDTPVPDGSSLKYNIYIGTNNYQAGVDLANKAVAEIADIQTKKVYIIKLSNANSLEERANGIKSVISNATIVSIEEAEELAINNIVENAAGAEVIFGTNMTTTVYVAKAVLENKLSPNYAYGFDENEYIDARISDGTIKGVMIQKSEEMGYLSVKEAITTTFGKTNETEYLSTEYKTKN